MFNNERELTPSWSLVRPSLELLRQNYEIVIIVVILPSLLFSFGSIYSGNRLEAIIILAIAGVWRLINMPVSYYLQVRAAGDKNPDLSECYRLGLPFWVKTVGFEILFFIMVIIGLILLIIPGLIIIRRYYLTPLYIVGNKMKIADAMRKSAEQTKPVSGYIWGMIGVIVVFGVIAIFLDEIAFIGPILAVLVSLIYFFGPALRWKEINRPDGKISK